AHAASAGICADLLHRRILLGRSARVSDLPRSKDLRDRAATRRADPYCKVGRCPAPPKAGLPAAANASAARSLLLVATSAPLSLPKSSSRARNSSPRSLRSRATQSTSKI